MICNGGKCGGILATARASASPARIDRVLLGLGLNVNTPRAALDAINRPVWPATSLLAEGVRRLAPTQVEG